MSASVEAASPHKKLSSNILDDSITDYEIPSYRLNLQKYFDKIEKEFNSLWLDNLDLKQKLNQSHAKLQSCKCTEKEIHPSKRDKGKSMLDSPNLVFNSSNIGSMKPGLKSVSKTLEAAYISASSKLSSAFKQNFCPCIKKFKGHRDGIWDISISNTFPNILATASVDQTVRIWNSFSGDCPYVYIGHKGSVNSVRFHPSKNILCTASGDRTCHLFTVPHDVSKFPTDSEKSSSRLQSSSVSLKRSNSVCQELETSSQTALRRPKSVPSLLNGSIDAAIPFDSDEASENFSLQASAVAHNNTKGLSIPAEFLTQSLMVMGGHLDVISAADWDSTGTKVITGSWDRTAKLWDSLTGQSIQTFSGHEQAILNVNTDPGQQLATTASADSTFRLWDFRAPTFTVNVFQGHSQAVRSALFSGVQNYILSASDDKTVKLWDLKNMRAAVVTLRLPTGINRLSVSNNKTLIALPLDNGKLRIYRFDGSRVASCVPNHNRVNTCSVWSLDNSFVYTGNFDFDILKWDVRTTRQS